MLLDEPLNAVDADTRDVIHEVLSELQKQGKTIVAATHDLGRLAEDFDAAVYRTRAGQVECADGATGGPAGKRTGMDWLLAPFQFSFMQTALAAAVLVAFSRASLGAYVVQRCMAFIGDALAHATLPGLVAAFLMGWNLSRGRDGAAVVTALGIGWFRAGRSCGEDTAIGVWFTGMFALGVLLNEGRGPTAT